MTAPSANVPNNLADKNADHASMNKATGRPDQPKQNETNSGPPLLIATLLILHMTTTYLPSHPTALLRTFFSS